MTFAAPIAAVSRRLSLLHALFLSSLAVSATVSPARADDGVRLNLLEENDSLYFNSDQHYTQGFRLSGLEPALTPQSFWNAPFNGMNAVLPVFAPNAQDVDRRYSFFLGQSIFTPSDIHTRAAQPFDRPYAGWAYVGSSMLQETNHRMLENFEVDLGVVGPAALGEQVQNDWHQLIGVKQAQGWGYQLRDEPGVVVSYERMWRLPVATIGSFGIDVVPEAGATVGNVFTYGDIGGMLRIGRNLGVDYGPARVRPALSGTDYFDASQMQGDLGYYFYIGGQGRAVIHNIFLDGNSYTDNTPHVAKKLFVGDLVGGVSLFWTQAVRVDFSAGLRSQEYEGQSSPDKLGTASITMQF